MTAPSLQPGDPSRTPSSATTPATPAGCPSSSRATRPSCTDDPFARIFPARPLHVGAGLLGRVRWPAGPVIERYGSAQPWPADRFG